MWWDGAARAGNADQLWTEAGGEGSGAFAPLGPTGLLGQKQGCCVSQLLSEPAPRQPPVSATQVGRGTPCPAVSWGSGAGDRAGALHRSQWERLNEAFTLCGKALE